MQTKTNLISTLLTLIGLILITPSLICAQKPSITQLRFYQYANSYSTSSLTQEFPQKSLRHNSQSGTFILNFEDTPDSIQTAAKAACEFWASKLKNRQPIRLNFSFMSLSDFGENLAILTTPSYMADTNPFMPSALFSHINNFEVSDNNQPDGLIWINSDLNWNCAFSSTSSSSQSLNLYSHILRSVAICLGFGSSVTEYEPSEGLCFQEIGHPSLFDHLIFSDNTRLSTLEDFSPELYEFTTNNPVYAYLKDQDHILFTPQEYHIGESLIFLDNPQSLMHYDLGYGNVFFDIDNLTIELLNEIGWDLQLNKTVSILCDDIDEDGIGSAYSAHSFKLSDENISQHNWTFKVFDAAANEIIVYESNNAVFLLPAIGDNPTYARNINGDIIGQLECIFEENGVVKSAIFKLSLELKPSINSIFNITKHWVDGSPNFGLTFCVDYSGADNLSVFIEQEYSSGITRQRIYEPFIAHVKIRSLAPIVYNWIDITVSNKYGSVTETIELEPTLRQVEQSELDAISTSTNRNVAIYNSQGICIGIYAERESYQLPLPTGLYIFKYSSDNFNSIEITKKIAIK